MKNLSFDLWPCTISSILAIFGCFLSIAFPIFIVCLARNNSLENKNFVSKFGGIYQLYRDENLFAKSF